MSNRIFQPDQGTLIMHKHGLARAFRQDASDGIWKPGPLSLDLRDGGLRLDGWRIQPFKNGGGPERLSPARGKRGHKHLVPQSAGRNMTALCGQNAQRLLDPGSYDTPIHICIHADNAWCKNCKKELTEQVAGNTPFDGRPTHFLLYEPSDAMRSVEGIPESIAKGYLCVLIMADKSSHDKPKATCSECDDEKAVRFVRATLGPSCD